MKLAHDISTHQQGQLEVATGFIQSKVVIKIASGEWFQIPPVIGQDFAVAIARHLRSDFPDAAISIQQRAHGSLKGLEQALLVSGDVDSRLTEFLLYERPGAALADHYRTVALKGGVQ